MGYEKSWSILVHIIANNAYMEGTTAIVEQCVHLLNRVKQSRVIRHVNNVETQEPRVIRHVNNVETQEPRVHEFKEGDNERNSAGYVQGRERMIRLFVGQLCVESADVHERRPAP